MVSKSVSIKSSRNAFVVATVACVAFLVYQFATTGAYQLSVISIVMASQVGYWISYAYYMRDDGVRDDNRTSH